MIKLSEIAEVGHFNKPHGIKGEISLSLDIDLDLNTIKYLIISIDGIFVPFFILSVRNKTADTYLITLDGIDSEEKAQEFTNRPIYIRRCDLPESDIDEEDGLYASDLIGFFIKDINAGTIGKITDVNDITQNILFVVESSDGKELLIPVADEFILSIDIEQEIVETDIPKEILTLND